MPVTDHSLVFSVLKPILVKYAPELSVKADTPLEYTLVTESAPPRPPHKGKPMFFGSVRDGKAYVSFHVMPLYTRPDLLNRVSPELKKRMQGKTCFNFRNAPPPESVEELDRLTAIALEEWRGKEWL